MRLLICDGQGLDDDDARVIAENLNKFKRLHRLDLVSWGRGGEGGEVVGVRLSCVCCRMSCDTCALEQQQYI